MSPKVQKQAVKFVEGEEVDRCDIAEFVLKIHFQFKELPKEYQKLHFPADVDPKQLKLSDIFNGVVKGSPHVHLDEIEEALALDNTKFYNQAGDELAVEKTVKNNGLKNGDVLGILVRPHTVVCRVDVDNVGSIEIEMEEPKADQPPAEEIHYGQVDGGDSDDEKALIITS